MSRDSERGASAAVQRPDTLLDIEHDPDAEVIDDAIMALRDSILYEGRTEQFGELSPHFKAGETLAYYLILNNDFGLEKNIEARTEFFKALRDKIRSTPNATSPTYKPEAFAEKRKTILNWLNTKIGETT